MATIKIMKSSLFYASRHRKTATVQPMSRYKFELLTEVSQENALVIPAKDQKEIERIRSAAFNYAKHHKIKISTRGDTKALHIFRVA